MQFTPDLMPGDITGSMVIDSKQGELSFREGPLFTNLLLADEINRTPPKTQSALLEAMEEGQVSVDGVSRPLPRPFLVAATQNPVEYEGTYPLPEAQLDRFLLKVVLPIPPRDAELEILRRHAAGFDPRDVAGAGVTRGVPVPPTSRPARPRCSGCRSRPRWPAYIVDIARATRESPSLSLGVSPRGATALMRAARAWAWLTGRDFVTPDDVKALAQATLAHRLGLRPEAELEGVQVGQVLDSALGSVPGPPLSPVARGPLMAISGRVPLLVLLGLVPVVLRPTFGTMWLWLLAVALVVAVDLLLAPRPEVLEISRRPTDPVRLGRPDVDHARRRQPVGPHRHRRCCGTPGSPRPERRANRFPIRLTPGDRVLLRTPLQPVRRGDLRAHGVTVRARGPLGLACAPAHDRRAGRGPVAAAVRVPQAPAVAAGPAARPRRPVGGAGARPGHRVRLAARVRPRRRRPLDRLAGHAPATATSSSAPGSPSATGGWCWCSTPRVPRRAASTTYPASTRRWTPRCCWPRWPPGPATASTSWPATAGCAPGCGRPAHARPPPPSRTRWPTSSRSSRRPTGPPSPAR